jgi:arginine decarboxylase
MQVSSHQTVLVFSVLHATQPLATETDPVKPDPSENHLVQQLYNVYSNINMKNLQENFHDAFQFKEESLTLFTLGIISLEERAKVSYLNFCI